MTKPKRPGIAFQNFVAQLERVFGHSDSRKVESPKRLRDRDTGRLREHDVVITWQHDHHVILTAIECRDYTRPVGVPDVEAFKLKCERTGIHHAVMVSASGFATTARTKAAAHDIVCMELSEADRFDWMTMDAIRVQTPHIVKWSLVIALDNPQDFTGAEPVYSEDGRLLSADVMAKNVHAQLALLHDNVEEGEIRRVTFRFNNPKFYALGRDGRRHPVQHVDANVEYTVSVKHQPISLHSYGSADKSYGVASADFGVGSVQGKLMFIKSDDGINVVFAPEESDRPAEKAVITPLPPKPGN